MFPVMNKVNGGYGEVLKDCPSAIPWGLLGPSEERQAQHNHSQTLKRLAERGGLSPRELYAVLRHEDFSYSSTNEHAVKYINGRVKLYYEAGGVPPDNGTASNASPDGGGENMRPDALAEGKEQV